MTGFLATQLNYVPVMVSLFVCSMMSHNARFDPVNEYHDTTIIQ